jgi:voltage-gated potassium channel
MDEIEVLEGSFLENELIGNIDFEHYKLILIGVVKTKKSNLMSHTLEILNSYFYFNPHAELVLEKGDVLIVIGDVRSINYFKNDVQKSSL